MVTVKTQMSYLGDRDSYLKRQRKIYEEKGIMTEKN